jgi:MFS family permease
MAMMMCIAVIAETFAKNTLNMSIVCMVNATANAINNKDNPDFGPVSAKTECNISAKIDHQYDGNLLWGLKLQSYLMSAIFFGGLISGLPAGYIADRYSPKLIVFICLVLNLIGTVFIPLATTWTAWMVFALRLIAGIGGQAAIFPTVTALCTRWIPPPERSTVIALYTSGVQIASIIGFPLNSFLCTKQNFLVGWPSIFYVNSGFVVVCGLLWFFIVTNNPSSTRRISTKEKDYIQHSLRGQGLKTKTLASVKTPWRYVLFSPVMICNIINAFLGGVVVVLLTTYLPMYFKDVIHVNIEENGMYTALPFICEWASKMLFALLADWMKTRTRLSPTFICKFFNTIGTVLPGIFLLLSSFTDCRNRSLPVLYVCLATFFVSGTIPGFFTSLVCIAPQFTGMVNSVARFSGQLSAVITPLAIGNIVKQGTPEEWKIVFIAVSTFLFVAAVLFIFLGSADIQPWAVIKIPDEETQKDGRVHRHHARHGELDEDNEKQSPKPEIGLNGDIYTIAPSAVKFSDQSKNGDIVIDNDDDLKF